MSPLRGQACIPFTGSRDQGFFAESSILVSSGDHGQCALLGEGVGELQMPTGMQELRPDILALPEGDVPRSPVLCAHTPRLL